MPKAKWGTGDEALTAADIDGAERSQFKPYDGEVPPSGLYRFEIKSMKQGESSGGNPKLTTTLTLDGSWKPKHAKYDGCPMWDHMPVMKNTAWRVAALCDAIGATSKDFHNGMVVDENGKVTKFGSVGDPSGLLVYVNVKHQPAANGYAESLRLNGSGYLPIDEAPDDEDGAADEDTARDDDGDDADLDEPPF